MKNIQLSFVEDWTWIVDPICSAIDLTQLILYQ